MQVITTNRAGSHTLRLEMFSTRRLFQQADDGGTRTTGRLRTTPVMVENTHEAVGASFVPLVVGALPGGSGLGAADLLREIR